jgi:hypothetical protein
MEMPNSHQQELQPIIKREIPWFVPHPQGQNVKPMPFMGT